MLSLNTLPAHQLAFVPLSQPVQLIQDPSQLSLGTSLNLASFSQPTVSPYVTTEQRVPMQALLNLQEVSDDSIIPCALNQQGDGCELQLNDETFQDVVRKNGFDVESYEVTTPDGYILEVFRIRTPQVKQMGNGSVPVIFMQHGILSSSWAFIANWSQFAPAFRYARQGYDVWLGNNRGNHFSRKNTHINADTDPKDFFAFSFQQMGQYDLPTQIDLARKTTGVDKVTYVGHSQGTTQMFYAMLANQPAVASRVNLFVALAPVVHMTHVDVPFLTDFAAHTDAISDALKAAGLYEFMGVYWTKYSDSFCGHWYFKYWCDALRDYEYSPDTNKYNYAERLHLNDLNSVDGISLRQIAHYGQVISDGYIADFDYGSEDANMQAYGQAQPRAYELSSINQVPIAMFVGAEDPIADPTDTAIARDKIQSVVFYKEYPNSDHSSFCYGRFNDWFVDALPVVQKYNGVSPAAPASGLL